ncbi:hypothetical protein F4861DRAFT_539189 [Xylaria intraflava]|nr:hypothetical protein F4861DRAFT_539189 [Xylaria intraflava]
MWARLFSPGLPTPLHSDVGHKNTREALQCEDENDAPLSRPPPKKRVRYSMHQIFDKYKTRKISNDELSIDRSRGRRYTRASPSPAPEPPIIEVLKRNYAALRVTLHSKAMKDVAKAEAALVMEAEEKIKANLSNLYKIDTKVHQLCASSLDCEVDTQISSKNDQRRTITIQMRNALSRYRDIEAKRSQQLAQLWATWETTQTNIEGLANRFHDLLGRESPKGTSGISSVNREWSDKEDLDIGRRSKQLVEDMASCEEEFQEKLKDEETNILEAMLKCSLG